MKTILSIALIFSAIYLQSQVITPLDSSIWNTNYDKALLDSKQKDMPMVIVFSGSDWCKPCIKLREYILVKPEFSDWAKNNVVLISADFPRQKKNALLPEQVAINEKLAEKYNKNGVFPLVIIINKEEKVLGELNYLDVTPAEYITKIEEIIKK